MAKLEEVFGVSAKPIRSYVEREDVDTRFKEALKSDKQVIVYGSSKQGKTSLVSKYLPYDQNLLVSLTPRTSVLDIYQTILSSAGIKIAAGTSEKSSSEASASLGAKVKALIPIFGSGSVGDRRLESCFGQRGKVRRGSHQTWSCPRRFMTCSSASDQKNG